MSTSWTPESCALPTAVRPLRAAEFDALFASAVRGVARPAPTRLTMELDPTGEVAARAADLVVRETACCSFFTFTLTATGGALGLSISVPSGQVDVLDALAARVGEPV